VLSHNKTLAAQLYAEFKAFFPDNAVEYFVSYYDYYQPEAYIAASDTYIEKDMAINAEIEKLRLRATASLLSGREDVIVISSVSCLYGMADPKAFEEKIIRLEEGQRYMGIRCDLSPLAAIVVGVEDELPFHYFLQEDCTHAGVSLRCSSPDDDGCRLVDLSSDGLVDPGAS